MKTQHSFKFIHTNGIRLHIIHAGSEKDPLVILLHGFPEFWFGWRNQIQPLAESGLRVLVPDQRGYNRSEKPRGVSNYTIAHLSADVIGLADACEREKFYLAGHDWGAAVAWETALRYPKRVEKLAILNVPHPDVMTRFLLSDPRQIRKSWYIFFFQIPHLPEAILRANDWEAAVQMLIRSSKRASEERQTFTKQDIEQYRQAWWQKDAMTSMIHWYRAAFRSRLHAARNPGKVAPRQVQVPTLMLWGKRDIALSAEMAQPSIDLCVDGRLILFEEASHWVQHDEANAVNQALIDFFNKNHTTSELGSRAQHWMAADS